MTYLERLLDNLNLGKEVSNGASFDEELEDAGFKIFCPISDLGFFSWIPKGGYKSLSQIKSDREITRHVDEDDKPDRLTPLKQIVTPVRFKSPISNVFENKFPYGGIDIACIHVATKVTVELLDFIRFAMRHLQITLLIHFVLSSV
mmetsp:Transcript_28322/g.60592  ORF Transcript_28322/g.60592 Transcript_28322/m.60592 type:complete len:146 (-) Transcript_28322:395-832(-)